MEEYTTNLHSVFNLAIQEAERLNSPAIESYHLLLAILRHHTGTAWNALEHLGVDPDKVKNAIDQRFRQMVSGSDTIPISRTSLRILRLMDIEASLYEAKVPGTLHLLLAILRERVNFPSTYLNEQYGITYERIEQLYPKPHHEPNNSAADYDVEDDDEEDDDSFISRLTNGMIHISVKKQKVSKSKSDTPTLDKYGRDLTALARKGELDPLVGRTEEVKRILQILSRRKKNNPILIGEPGAGKSAIVEGLAQQITDRRIVALDLASMVAGTTYRGQFEQRMKDVMTELKDHKDIILFVDEIHTLIGAGNAQGSLDAANILKPALARGEVQCIGATTTAEYRTSIEKDGALERRFQKVTVAPTTTAETLAILRQLSKRYEAFHHCQYTDEALQACVSLTDRYVSDRVLPDKAIDAMDEAGSRGKRTITAEDIAKVVSQMSGVPVQRVAKKENEQLLQMDARLKKRVIGQDKAIDRLVKAIRRSRMGLRDPNRPIGTFFFLGPTGVGKTYLTQCLAEEMFGSKDAMIRFDMSEYMEKHTVSLLVGAPPGYVAHEDGGKLTEAVRRKPYSIVLFDEIEKAHPDIFNVLLQLLDEGRLTDRQGHQVDFRNTVIILTSNVGTRQLRDFGAGIGFGAGEITPEVAEKTITKALERTFPPEFVNRIDDIISFAPLSRETLRTIVEIEVGKLQKRLKENGRRLVVSNQVYDALLDKAYDPKNGARPIKRAVQTYLEDSLTELLLRNPDQKTIKLNNI